MTFPIFLLMLRNEQRHNIKFQQDKIILSKNDKDKDKDKDIKKSYLQTIKYLISTGDDVYPYIMFN